MDIFSNPIIIGGILPMIFFSLMDFSFRLFAGNHPFPRVFFYMALGGMTMMTLLTFFLFGVSPSDFLALFTFKSLLVGIMFGVIWAICITSMGVAYEKYNAQASQVVPLASSNAFLSAFLGIIFLGEESSLLLFVFVVIALVIGIYLVIRSEAREVTVKAPLISLLIGGGIPFLGFGVMNFLFKVFSELNSGVLGVIMSFTGMCIALLLHYHRNMKISFEPALFVPGFFWAGAVGFLGYGFWPLMGEVSVLLTIVGASPLLTILLAMLFLKEKVYLRLLLLGAFLIVGGIMTLNFFG